MDNNELRNDFISLERNKSEFISLERENKGISGSDIAKIVEDSDTTFEVIPKVKTKNNWKVIFL